MTKYSSIFRVLVLFFLAAIPACSPQPELLESTSTPEITQQITAGPSQTPVDISPTSTAEDVLNIDLPQGIELEFWHAWSGSQADVFEALTEEFNQTNQWGIQVDIQGHGDEMVMLDDVNQAVAADALPDIIAAPSQYLNLWDEQGIIINDLNNYIDSREFGLSQETLNAFLPVFWNQDFDGEKRWGVPAYRSGHFLFYNQSWAQDLGFDDYPQTISAFKQQACAAANTNLLDDGVENNGTGGWIYDTQSLTALSWFKSFTGDALLEDSNIDFRLGSNQAALEYLYDLYGEDCSWTGKQNVPYEYFAKRYALFYSGGSEDIFIQELANEENLNSDEWIIIPYPSDDHRPVVMVEGSSYAVIGTEEDKNLAAWLFVRFMLAEENQVTIIEETGSLPISNAAISLLSDFRAEHPAWEQALQYIALAQPTPLFSQWIAVEPVFSDIAWQLKFTQTKENIPSILVEANAIVQGMSTE